MSTALRYKSVCLCQRLFKPYNTCRYSHTVACLVEALIHALIAEPSIHLYSTSAYTFLTFILIIHLHTILLRVYYCSSKRRCHYQLFIEKGNQREVESKQASMPTDQKGSRAPPIMPYQNNSLMLAARPICLPTPKRRPAKQLFLFRYFMSTAGNIILSLTCRSISKMPSSHAAQSFLPS
jgi:hypothetical protein